MAMRKIAFLSFLAFTTLGSASSTAKEPSADNSTYYSKPSGHALIAQKTSAYLEELADQRFKQYEPGTGAAEIEAVEEKIEQLSPKEAAEFRKIVREREYDISEPEISDDLSKFDEIVSKSVSKLFKKETKYRLKKEERDELFNSLKSDQEFLKIVRKLEKLSENRKDKKNKSFVPNDLLASSDITQTKIEMKDEKVSLNFGNCPLATYGTGVTILRTPRTGVYYGSSFSRDVVNTSGETPCDYELSTPVSGMRYVTHNSSAGKCILDQFNSIGSNSTRNRFIFGSLRIWLFCDAFWDGRSITRYINFSNQLY